MPQSRGTKTTRLETMQTPLSSLPTASFPPLEHAWQVLTSVDYKKQAIRALLLLATVAAIIVGVSSFIYRNARKFWAEHGEAITLAFYEFINWLEIFIEKVYQAGVIARPIVVLYVNKMVDRAFYKLTEVA